MHEDLGSGTKPLLRSTADHRLGGVAGGIAHYFNVDSTLVRLLWLIAVPLSGGIALLAYFGLWLLLPEGDAGWAQPAFGYGHHDGARVLGAVLVGLGAIVLLSRLAPLAMHVGHFIWPVLLIALGAALLLRRGPRYI